MVCDECAIKTVTVSSWCGDDGDDVSAEGRTDWCCGSSKSMLADLFGCIVWSGFTQLQGHRVIQL
jgi:hypothetical protein